MNKQELMELLKNANNKYYEYNDNYYNDFENIYTKIENQYKNNFENETLQYNYL